MSTIYATAECNCWARDFNYNEYVYWCSEVGNSPMCEAAYKLICQALDIDLEDDNKSGGYVTTKADIVKAVS